MSVLLHWLAVHTGTVNESGPYYGFFSGFGSDLGEIALIGGIIGMYRKVNCHEPRCLRIAHHEIEIDGVKYKVCRRHHPVVRDHHATGRQSIASLIERSKGES